ncbi:type 1 glutamine amidotransferase family protein [Chitinimonas naiadis]
MTKTLIAIRHIDFEDLGSFAEPLVKAGYAIRYQRPDDDLHAAEHADLLVVLGGPMGVYEQDRHPWIQRELVLIRQRLDAGKPTLGICFGAQLMAAALGAKVYAGSAGKEIGFYPLTLSADGLASPLRHLAGGDKQMFHWHGDTFDLPQGARLLASSERYPNQVFAIGQHGLGLQCHPELQSGRIGEWLTGHAAELHAAGIDPATLQAGAERHGPEMSRRGQQALAAWLDELV